MGDYRQDVENLAIKHRAKQALRSLMAAGAPATPALRAGLRHADPGVRVGCCIVVDHHLDEAALPELMANLQHEHERVREWALHALACDRCKEGECRPGEDDVVPLTLQMRSEDPSRRVRAQAVHLLGQSAAIRRAEVLAALQQTHISDPNPNVRKIASKYVPGGPVYQRRFLRGAALLTSGPRRPYRRKSRSRAEGPTP